MSQFDKIRYPFYSAWLLLFFCISLILPAHAETKEGLDIVVALSKNTRPYQQFYDQLETTLTSETQQDISFHVFYEDIGESISELYNADIDPDFIIAVGTLAMREMINIDVSAPVIFSLIPASSYQHSVQKNPLCKTKGRCSAVYLEQPIDRQFSIIKKGLPDIQRLGIILGSTSAGLRDNISRAGEKYQIDVRIKQAGKDDNIIMLTDSLSKTTDVLLAIPDPDIYNRRTAKGILINTYKYKIPFIAYSHSFVRAGALLAIYSTPEQIARQTGMMLIRTTLSPNRKLPLPEYPDTFKVEINPAVMRSLRDTINFDDSILDNQ